jgi:transposase
MTTYVGIDVHASQSTIAVVTTEQPKPRIRTVRGGPLEVKKQLLKLEVPFDACFEASCGYGVWFETLSGVARSVSVAHPGHLRLIYGSKRKNDRVDAAKLAKLLSVGAVPAVYVPNIQVREWRGLIRHRSRKVSQRTAVKNSIRALLREHAIQAPRSLWGKRGLSWLEQLELPRVARFRLQDYLEDLRLLQKRVARLTRELDAIARRHPGVSLLKTIPGIGNRTAEAFVAWVDQPRRFARIKQIGDYFGLVPRQDASAKRNYLGHITKDGPACVRGLMVEAAWQGVRRSPFVRAKFEQFKHEDKERTKKAIVATAHWLTRVMLSMLRSGEAWRHEG